MRLILNLSQAKVFGEYFTRDILTRVFVIILVFFPSIIIMSERHIMQNSEIINLSPSTSATIKTSSTSAGYFSFRRWRFWSKRLYPLGATRGDLSIDEITLIKVRIKVRVCQFWTDG